MDEASDRRSFLRGLASQAIRGAQVIAPLPAILTSTSPAPVDEEQAETIAPGPAAPGPAAPATHFASLEELSALAGEVGLETRIPALERLAERSGRLSLDPGEGDAVAGFLGRYPDTLPALTRFGGDLGGSDFFACIDLDAVRRAIDSSAPASLGRVWIFAGPDTEPRIQVEPQATYDQTGAGPANSQRLHVSPELVLPRPWSAPVEALELTQREQVAWQRLRQLLAHAQGVETADTAQRPAPIHRTFGYPDETASAPPLPRAGRLLVQLSTDPDLGLELGPAERRLYVWAPARELRSGRLDAAQAVTC